MSERIVLAEHSERREVVHRVVRSVLDHRDLLEHDLALLLDLAPGRRAKHVGHHVERDRQVIVEHAGVQKGRVLGGRRVELGAELVEQLGDRGGVVARSALEQQVLDEVRESALVGPLVSRAGIDPEADRDRADPVHVLRGDTEATRERRHTMHRCMVGVAHVTGAVSCVRARIAAATSSGRSIIGMWPVRGSIRSRRGGQRRREPGPSGRVDHLILARRRRRAPGLARDRSDRAGPRARSRCRRRRSTVPACEPRASSRMVCSSSASGSATRRENARRRSARECGRIGATTRVTSRPARCSSGSRHERRTSPVAIRPAGATSAIARTASGRASACTSATPPPIE